MPGGQRVPCGCAFGDLQGRGAPAVESCIALDASVDPRRAESSYWTIERLIATYADNVIVYDDGAPRTKHITA